MTILILALLISYGLDALVYWQFWQSRRLLVPVSAAIGVFAAAGMSFWHFDLASLAVGLVGAYRFLNGLVLADGRGHDEYLRRRTLRSMVCFAAVQSVLVASWAVPLTYGAVDHLRYAGIVGAVSASIFGVISVVSVIWSRAVTAYVEATGVMKDKDLPAVSLAIPARNETEVLERTLRAAVASDYPKLEILVLDDCSQDATADIIKGFAHDGVRFVQGAPVPDGHWVHKNYACQQLLDQASGTLVLFAGVDVSLAPDSISRMVAYFTRQKLGMLAVLPDRDPAASGAIVQTIRYWWELALPRRLLRRPPVLSSCWMADAKRLKKLGGFGSVSRKVVPEAYFAREFGAQGAYAMIRGSRKLGVVSRKAAAEQFATALRVRYPQVRRRPELAMGMAAAVLLAYVAPLYLMVSGRPMPSVAIFLALAGWLLASASYAVVSATYISFGSRGFWPTIAASPFMPFIDVILLHVSMYQYEFGKIEWKGRNVCLPVMHVYRSLPPITDDRDMSGAGRAKKP